MTIYFHFIFILLADVGLCISQDLCGVRILSNEINLSNHTSSDRHPSWSPDGHEIVFESDRTGKWGIYKMSSEGKNTECLLCDEFNNRIPSFHPDGLIVLFESDRLGAVSLFTLDIKSKQVKQAVDNTSNLESLQWGTFSPDGKRIAFSGGSTKKKNNPNIYLHCFRNGKTSQLTKDSTRSLYPSWSPDSRNLIFFSRRDTEDKDDELYIINVKSSKLKRMTHHSLNDFCPFWSTQNFIVYVKSMKNVKPELYLLDLDSKSECRLTFNEDGDTEPSVSPDGNNVAWTGFRNGNFEIILGSIIRN